ncbi:MAG: srrA 4 [Firmicutes bacterium]|nr:srrA 4 [Bacillota bacterium]
MTKVLIVDDEDTTRNTISWYLKKEGFQVFTSPSGEDALLMETSIQPDLIVLDIIMPGMSGLEVARNIPRQVPIIFLTALGQETDKLTGFNLGAEDYVTKPFSPRELVARIKVVLRRYGKSPMEDHISCPPFEINIKARKIKVAQTEPYLTAKEFDLLLFLIRNSNTIFSREALITNVWGYEYDGDARVVDTTIKRLRHKLGAQHRDCLKTIRSSGYMLEVITNE